MRSDQRPWDGNEWQDYCTHLLYLKFGGRYQQIFDRDGGDGGLEGHSTDGSGIGYQCYAPASTLGIAQRRDAQKRKITATIKKLIDNRERLTKIIGTHVLEEVSFLFPRCESQYVNAHLRIKEAELREAVALHPIAYLDRNVLLSAHEAEDLFVVEIAELQRVGAMHARLPSVEISADDVVAAIEAAGDELDGPRAKLDRRFGAARVAALMRVILEDHLRAKALEEHLGERSPPVFEEYVRVTQQQRRRVERLSLEGGTGGESLTSFADEMCDALAESIPGLRRDDAQELASGVVAEWLIECPLDFPATA